MQARRMVSLAAMAAGMLLTAAAAWGAADEARGPGHEIDPFEVARSFERVIRRVAEQVGPAVVNLSIVRETSNPFGLDEESIPDDLPDGLRERFRDYFDRFRDGEPFRMRGNGSGVVISPDGYILTSEHVIHDAVEIVVTMANRRRYDAEVVGSDPRRDLAVIRVDAKGLPVARLGDARELHRGQFVLALGSPFGFGRDGQASISFGVVSGTSRAIPGIGRELDRYYGNLIQTDAAVNPGNSGGPLVNLEGEVVGVNAVISSRDGSSDGVGFAVPITARTRSIIERLKRGEAIEYGFLGVEMHEVTPEEAERTGAQVGIGAYVSRVLDGTPARKAGIRPGDVILRVDNEAILDPDDLVQVVQATPVGEKLELRVLRNRRERTLEVMTTRRPPAETLLASSLQRLWWRGMRVEPLTEDLRETADLDAEKQGVFVKEVRDGSKAARAGIEPGMVIDQVGDRKVASVGEFQDATGDLDGPVFVHVVGKGVKVIQPPGIDDDAEGTSEDTPPDESDD